MYPMFSLALARISYRQRPNASSPIAGLFLPSSTDIIVDYCLPGRKTAAKGIWNTDFCLHLPVGTGGACSFFLEAMGIKKKKNADERNTKSCLSRLLQNVFLGETRRRDGGEI